MPAPLDTLIDWLIDWLISGMFTALSLYVVMIKTASYLLDVVVWNEWLWIDTQTPMIDVNLYHTSSFCLYIKSTQLSSQYSSYSCFSWVFLLCFLYPTFSCCSSCYWRQICVFCHWWELSIKAVDTHVCRWRFYLLFCVFYFFCLLAGACLFLLLARCSRSWKL